MSDYELKDLYCPKCKEKGIDWVIRYEIDFYYNDGVVHCDGGMSEYSDAYRKHNIDVISERGYCPSCDENVSIDEAIDFTKRKEDK